jgi:hypothetical protein
MCGSSKETTVVQSSGTQQATATPEERELMRMDIDARKQIQPQQLETQKAGLDLVNRLLAGETDLPGFFGQIGRGISPEITSEISQKAVADLMPSFQASGIMDSGVSASVAGRTAGDIRRVSEEFNIGNKLNLLNLALSGQAQVQQPILAQSSQLASQLAGLRAITTTGQSTSTMTKPRDYLSPLIQGVGTGIGSGFGAGAANWWGGD